MPLSTRIALLAVVAAGALPGVAAAAETWQHDTQYTSQSTGALTCGTGATYEPGTSDLIDEISPSIGPAQGYWDTAAPPAAAGGELYVSVDEWAALGDACAKDGGTRAHLEIALPEGAQIATDAPFLCGFGKQAAAQCPVVVRPAPDGGLSLLDGRGGGAVDWSVPDAYNKFRLLVPVQVHRAFASFATTPERFCDDGPCPSPNNADRVQFLARFAPGSAAAWSPVLMSTVGLQTGTGAAPGGGGGGSGTGPAPGGQSSDGGGGGGPVIAPGPGTTTPAAGGLFAAAPPSALAARTLRRGLAVRVTAPSAGAVMGATLTAGGRTLARASATAQVAGALTLRLTGRSAVLARAFGSRRRLTARLTVSARVKGATTSQARTVTLRR